jgi:hypothetical protein
MIHIIGITRDFFSHSLNEARFARNFFPDVTRFIRNRFPSFERLQ